MAASGVRQYDSGRGPTAAPLPSSRSDFRLMVAAGLRLHPPLIRWLPARSRPPSYRLVIMMAMVLSVSIIVVMAMVLVPAQVPAMVPPALHLL
jgi:hypothetical protein